MNYEFLDNEEGCVLHSYQDAAGIWTIGWGSTRMNGHPVRCGQTITQQQADDLRDQEIADKLSEIKKYLKASLNDNQLTAIISLTYNIGVVGFVNSSLLPIINKNPVDKTMIPFKNVTDISVSNYMQENKITEINIIELHFMIWNKITSPTTHHHVFDIDLLLRRRREYALYSK